MRRSALSFVPNDGVGLVREEFIISNSIKIHPMALVKYGELKDQAVKAEIDRLTYGYTDKPQYFVDRLAEGVATIAAAFYPKDVIVRLSDFKTNEYAESSRWQLLRAQGRKPNAGVSRRFSVLRSQVSRRLCPRMPSDEEARDNMGLSNIKLMVPFCRTVDEGRLVIAELEKHGLKRGENALEVYVMCEIPSNVILADQFAEVFDGFSIGSNDLTQLVLGVDRDSEIVAHVFDERNDAVKEMITSVIRAAKSKGERLGSVAKLLATIRTSRSSWSSRASTVFPSIQTWC